MERLMQYVWQHRLIPGHGLATVDGRRVKVIDQGRLNTAPGPDFFNAKIEIDGKMWAGDVEIHVRASDWHRHGHDSDAAYDSVILHVVDRDDTMIHRRNGEVIPQMALRCAADFGDSYRRLTDLAAGPVLACKGAIGEVPQVYLTDWIASLAAERLHEKADRIKALMERFQGDWTRAVFVTVARALGFGNNSQPFELLALSVPLKILFKHADSILAIEALLFGQSGLLDGAPEADPYVGRLVTEYRFLAAKYGLRRPEGMRWKLGGTRPGNFPHRRIALLAAMVFSGFALPADILTVETEEDAAKLFNIELSGYWRNHFTFGPESRYAPEALSPASLRTLMINVVAPAILAHGTLRGNPDAMPLAMTLLEELPPERNSIITLFTQAGLKAPDALSTQALIQLRRAYCETRKCLYCRIGHRLLASQALRPQ